jgi:LysM repeat protein
MPPQLDVEKIIADNPNIDADELKKAQEALQDLHQTGKVKRSTYGLETPESKKNIRYSEEAYRSAREPAVRRLR